MSKSNLEKTCQLALATLVVIFVSKQDATAARDGPVESRESVKYDWIYLEEYLEEHGSDKPTENAAFLAALYARLSERLEHMGLEELDLEVKDRQALDRAMAKPIEKYPALRSILVQLAKLLYITKNRPIDGRKLEFGYIRGRPITQSEEVEEGSDLRCQHAETTFANILKDLDWIESFKLSDGQLSRRSGKPEVKVSRLRAYVAHYMRQHYTHCPEMLYGWLIRGLQESTGSEPQNSLSRRAELVFRPLENELAAERLDERMEESLDELRELCEQMRLAIGPVIKIYDNNELLTGRPYLNTLQGKILHRWQSRYHLCLRDTHD